MLECVVLERDLPEHGLRKGDVGTVVDTYDPNGLEVEFVAATGETRAVLTIKHEDVRRASASDMLAARSTAI